MRRIVVVSNRAARSGCASVNMKSARPPSMRHGGSENARLLVLSAPSKPS